MNSNKVVNNAKWIILCKIVQSLLQMAIGMISARYLGPSNYGLIGYASSVVAFVLPIMQLGLPSTLIQELVGTPEEEGKIMGTAMIMDFVSGIGCMILVGGFVLVANRGETETIIVCMLYSVSLLFRAMELMQYWFQYRFESKYPSIVMLCSYVVVSAYKIYILIAGKNVYWFVMVNSIDYAINGIALLVISSRIGIRRLSFSFSMVRRLFAKGKFYILASMMVTIYNNTDHIMLKMFSSVTENGYYTAAITCTCIGSFLFMAVIDSFRPVILTDKKEGSLNYEKNISRLYCIITYMALVQSVLFTVLASLIVRILYGIDYLPTIPVLQILIWQVSFSYMGIVRNIWILAEGKEKILWKLNLAGVTINILLNAFAIPCWGACGAAAASLATQIFTNFVLGFIVKPIQPNSRLLLKGLTPYLIYDIWYEWLSERKQS